MPLKDLPVALRPREKLLAQGAAALADAELLALLLRTGLPGTGVLQLAEQLLAAFGGLPGLLQANAEDLRSVRGLGPAKRAEVVAVLELARRSLKRQLHDGPVFDATCPLVTKVHVEVAKLAREGYEFVMIGHKGHPEVEGTMGQLSEGIYLVEDVDDVERVVVRNPERLAVVTQTTLSVDDAAQILAAVKRRFPLVREPKQQDICYATQNRQDAVKLLAPDVDVVVVVGSPTSSNSNRLRELAERLGTPAYMVDQPEDLQAAWFEGKSKVGLTAGASAPEILVQHVIERLRALGAVSVRKLPGAAETVHFPLPKGLRID
jgi:(E)-4-hydroxy-3-methyl-but-2-enyl pyrophosphate reductase